MPQECPEPVTPNLPRWRRKSGNRTGLQRIGDNFVRPIESQTSVTPAAPPARDATLAKAARDLEASFLSFMLREAGVGAPPSTFGGGSGEEQFTTFLTDAYAAEIAETGGIGLAERLYQALKVAADGRS
jgi:Rod binding domain-containing protein